MTTTRRLSHRELLCQYVFPGIPTILPAQHGNERNSGEVAGSQLHVRLDSAIPSVVSDQVSSGVHGPLEHTY